MSFENKMLEQGTLSLFLGSALGFTDKRQVDEFLLQPNAKALIRSTPYQDVFIVIKTVGLADSLEILPLTSGEQRRGFIDLDCWRKDSCHMPSLMEWLAAFIQCGPEETVRLARAVDADLLALFLKENIQVHLLDPEEAPPELNLILTPDQQFGVEVTSEAEGATMSCLLLDALFRFDPSLGYDLIDRVYWENRTSLEEDAYQGRRRRLEEIGFVDYYEALEIYGTADRELFPTKPLANQEEGMDRSSTLPALLVASLSPGQYLWETLQGIQEREEAERIKQGLAALANRILSVHSVTPGDLEKVRPALEEIRDTLSLGLEYLSQGQKGLVSGLLQQNDVRELFRIGFNLIADLRQEAELILSRRGLRLEGVEETLLEFPEAEFLSGLRRLRPLFFEGLEDPGEAAYRNFRSLRDIEISKRLLNQIEGLRRSFWKLFPKVSVERLRDLSRNATLNLSDLRFSQIFNTAVVKVFHQGTFLPGVLTAADLQGFLRFVLQERLSQDQFVQWLVFLGQSSIDKLVENSQERAILLQFVRRWCQACVEELFPIVGQENLDLRFIRTLSCSVDGVPRA